MRLKKSILALTLTTALLATSCAAPKKAVEESHTEVQSSAQLHTQETALLDAATAARLERMVEERIRQRWKTISTTDEATERVTEIFDTTQPTDSATGTPPLLCRTTERREARQTSESREQSETTAAGTETLTLNTAETLAETKVTESEDESRNETESKSQEEKRSGNTAARIALALTVLALLTASAAYIKTRLKNH